MASHWTTEKLLMKHLPDTPRLSILQIHAASKLVWCLLIWDAIDGLGSLRATSVVGCGHPYLTHHSAILGILRDR